MSVSKITKFDLVEQADAAVVDFYADWCGPCAMLSPIVDKISDEYQNVDFFKLDIDANMNTAIEYGIVSIPTLMFFKNGQKVGQVVGYMEEDALKAELDKAFQ